MSTRPAFSAEKSTAARQRLVHTLLDNGSLRSPRLAEAFATVPREAFVPTFYQDQGRDWLPQSAATCSSEEEWLALIYADTSLVTKLSERGTPLSSSSMPSVMARMLEALQVQPGQRVLEIGTGTGYNAALLALLTRNPSLVTTIEIDVRLAEQARAVLHQTVGAVDVQVGDGSQGVVEDHVASFDRLIATAACRAFPWSWYRRLAPGGRLVMDLQGKLGVSSFLVLQKAPDGKSGQGTFQVPPLYFMPMQEAVSMPSLHASSQTSWDLPADHPLPHALQDASFRWFVQWRLAGLGLSGSQGALQHPRSGERVIFLRLRDGAGYTRLDLEQVAGRGWRVQCVGSPALWDELAQARAEWEALGRPGQEAYRLDITGEQAVFLVKERRLPLF